MIKRHKFRKNIKIINYTKNSQINKTSKNKSLKDKIKE